MLDAAMDGRSDRLPSTADRLNPAVRNEDRCR